MLSELYLHITTTTLPYLILVVSMALLPACGSGGSESDAVPVTQEQSENRPGLQNNAPATGRLIDSAVSGIYFITDTHEGFTDAEGRFSYNSGEHIEFFIGNIQLGSTLAGDIITPLHLSFDNTNINNPTTLNILRLLQTLDSDGHPDNGITISEATHNAALSEATLLIDATVSVEDFETNSTLNNFIAAQTNLSELISSDQAVAHFETSLALLAEPSSATR